nr:hypothetical protein [Tanacetum cinerariifolium]
MCLKVLKLSNQERIRVRLRRPIGLKSCATWDRDSITWEGRDEGVGTVQVMSPPIVTTPNVVTPIVEKTNDGFQTVGKKKKRKGKSKSTNGGQFVGPLVKQNLRYEPKATTSEPKKGVTNVGNASKSSFMLKSTGTSSGNGNINTSNSYSALEIKEGEDEEHVENVYDEPVNLFPNLKTDESSSFMVVVG